MNVEIDGKHYLVGKAAQNSTIDRISTDLNSRSRKAHMPAAKMVPLSTIAAKVVQHAYEEGEDIFSPLTANVVMATSLPIEDIENNPADREFYRGLFINNNHIIVFNNEESSKFTPCSKHVLSLSVAIIVEIFESSSLILII